MNFEELQKILIYLQLAMVDYMKLLKKIVPAEIYTVFLATFRADLDEKLKEIFDEKPQEDLIKNAK